MLPTLRLGVHGRVQVAFAVVGLVVSAFLAAVSWTLTNSYLHTQRELTATRATLVSADLLERRLADNRRVTVQALQESAGLGNDAVFLPAGGAGGVSSTPRLQVDEVPPALLELASAGTPAQQRFVLDGRTVLGVALPLQDDAGVYVELFSLQVLDATLYRLSLVLAATSVLATVLAAALGRWAASRTLRPLRTLVEAAGAVARGDLDTRLDADEDPDLVPLAQAFNSTADALRARVERDARFASDVSHELRSPVTTMLNAAELLQNRRDELSPCGQEALDLLHGEVQGFRATVADLLEVSRDDQCLDVHREPVLLAPFVGRAADAHAGRPVTRVAPGARDALVLADRRRLERLVVNLVTNAEVHGGGVRDVLVERRDEVVRITVCDQGPGIPPQDRERVFERFYRGSASRAGVSGSGLGLAIVAQHVQAHGGRVWVEDAEPSGAAFVVELPVADSDEVA